MELSKEDIRKLTKEHLESRNYYEEVTNWFNSVARMLQK